MAAHSHHHVHLDEVDWAAWADASELEGEVLLGFVTDAATRVRDLCGVDAEPVRRVLDIGSGPGVGTCELARIFPEAEVVAVDSSPAMLERVTRRATVFGLDGRIRTHLAELPGGMTDLGPAQVIWASMSLHHVGDEVAGLRVLGANLAADGLIAVAEFGDPLRVLPDDLDVGRPGLAGRLADAGAAWFAAMRRDLPGATPSGDLPTMVRDAGLEVVFTATLTKHMEPPLADKARRFAVDHITRAKGQLATYLDDDDLAALAVLTDSNDPRSVQHRPDAVVVASRQIVIAGPTSGRWASPAGDT